MENTSRSIALCKTSWFVWLEITNGSDVMVIGHEKLGAIHNEPLLRWYLSLFKQVLYSGNRKLLVVGYGFRDQHVNEIIWNAIEKHQLHLYVLSPKQPSDFRDELFSLPQTALPRDRNLEVTRWLSPWYPARFL